VSKNGIKWLLCLTFLALALGGCAALAALRGENAVVATQERTAMEPTRQGNSTAQTGPTLQSTATATSSPSPAPTATPTPDLRLPPEEWQSWPIVPTLSASMAEVYARGIAVGNDPRHFSKVGDCQLVPGAFFGVYDQQGDFYELEPGDEYLQGTIDNFAGSFGREGFALHGGFTFPSVFSPIRADPQFCNPGETPIACEFRVYKPTFVFIAMEFRWWGRTPENYEDYLRQAVELALEKGIVPILATKADNREFDHSINLTTVRVAYEYDLPLWNFWLAVQPLPNHGIKNYPYGFHTTLTAWGVRSYTGLQTLDSLWRAAREYVGKQ
jgi:hypothetical protein